MSRVDRSADFLFAHDDTEALSTAHRMGPLGRGPNDARLERERAVSEMVRHGLTLARTRARQHANEGRGLYAAILNSLSEQVAVLDRSGVIIAVNPAWTLDAPVPGIPGGLRIAVGANYLDVCRNSAAAGNDDARAAGDGIRGVCNCAAAYFEREYVRHSWEPEQWQLMTVTPLVRPEGGAVVMYRDITERRKVEQRLREISGRLIAAQEEERRRLARELHDDLSQTLALLTIELEQLCLRPPVAGGALTSRLREVWQRATDLTGQVRVLSHHIHPSRLEALGLVASLRGFCREFGVRHDLDLDFVDEGMPAEIPMDAALCAYRIVQEALRNVIKHSAAAEAHVGLEGVPGGIHLRITDSGVGFDPDATSGDGLGLVSMRERLHLAGGTLSIASARGQGTRMDVYIPIPVTAMPIEAERCST